MKYKQAMELVRALDLSCECSGLCNCANLAIADAIIAADRAARSECLAIAVSRSGMTGGSVAAAIRDTMGPDNPRNTAQKIRRVMEADHAE